MGSWGLMVIFFDQKQTLFWGWSLYEFGMIMGCMWDDAGMILIWFWDDVETIFRMCSGFVKWIWEWIWNAFGIILKRLWDDVGMTLWWIWYAFGIMLGECWPPALTSAVEFYVLNMFSYIALLWTLEKIKQKPVWSPMRGSLIHTPVRGTTPLMNLIPD